MRISTAIDLYENRPVRPGDASKAADRQLHITSYDNGEYVEIAWEGVKRHWISRKDIKRLAENIN